LAAQFNPGWRLDSSLILENIDLPRGNWLLWRELYCLVLHQLPVEEMAVIGDRLRDYNPKTVLLRQAIESVWEAIVQADDWKPFQDLIQKLHAKA
jgi:uncharacterized protein YdiU (UPF0061 family)